MKTFLLVDSSALCYKAFFISNFMQSTGEKNYAIVHGFFSMLKSVSTKLGCSNWAFFWDSKHSLRKKMFPEYKGNREKTPEVLEAFEQFDLLRTELLPQCRFMNSFVKKGYEADDLIASVCKNDPPDDDMHYYILSSDKDLYQLLSRRVSMVKLVKSATGVYGYSEFVSEYGIRPKDWKEVKALCGCTTDNVPGLPRVGEKTAIAYIKGENKRGVDKLLQLLDTAEGHDLVERNRKLTTLPYEGTPLLTLDWNTRPDSDAFFEMCERLGFKRFQKERNAWNALLTGKKISRRISFI